MIVEPGPVVIAPKVPMPVVEIFMSDASFEPVTDPSAISAVTTWPNSGADPVPFNTVPAAPAAVAVSEVAVVA